MLNLTEIKTGKKIIWNGEPYVVMDYQHSKIGRGGAVMRTIPFAITGTLGDLRFWIPVGVALGLTVLIIFVVLTRRRRRRAPP